MTGVMLSLYCRAGLEQWMNLFEILTWNQLRIHNKKIYILNSDGFYNHLQKHIKQMQKEGFLQDELIRGLLYFCNSPIELF